MNDAMLYKRGKGSKIQAFSIQLRVSHQFLVTVPVVQKRAGIYRDKLYHSRKPRRFRFL